MDCSSLQCESCYFAKHHRSTYLPKSNLIHSDVWSPSKAINDEFTFIDVHMRLCWIYLIHKKSDFCIMIENQFQAKVGILHSDNGTKYFNEQLGDF